MYITVVMMGALQINTCTCTLTGLLYVSPNNSTNASCPSQPCATLNQYLLNISEMSNVKFLFLSGTHSLTSNITIQHAYNVSIVGDSYNTYLPPVILFCHSKNTKIVFAYSSNITIAKIMFKNCGGTGPTIMPRYDIKYYTAAKDLAATLFLNTCYYCVVRYVTFMGYGIMANNLLGDSYLEDIILYLDTTEDTDGLRRRCNQMLKLMNYGESSYINSVNLININKITVDGFAHGSQVFHDCDIGMRIDIEKTNYNTNLVLSKSRFNYLYTQHMLKIGLLQGVSSRNTVLIKDCEFYNNGHLATTSKSTIVVFIASVNVSLYFINCLFTKNNNKPPLMSIKVLDYHSSYVRQSNKFDDHDLPLGWCTFPSYICIKQCNFMDNTGPLMNIKGTKISKCTVRISIIGPFKILRNNAKEEDLIEIHRAVVNITGEAIFSHNFYAKNILSFDSSTVTFHKNISFILNIHCDQILTLQSEFVYIKLLENANIEFVDNNYNNYLIKVIVNGYIPYPPCFFQYITFAQKEALLKNFSIKFHGNNKDYMANFFRIEDDDSPVILLFNYYVFHCKWLPEANLNGYHPADINKQIIHTDDKQMYQHTRVCYCFMNNTYDCSLDMLGPVFPGQVLQVDLCMPYDNGLFILYVDTHNIFLPNSACTVAHQNQMISTITNYSKTYNFTIVSNSTTECELFLTAQPDLYKRYAAFYVQLLPCPIGFKLQNGVCDCDPILSIITDECYIDYSTIRRPANYWIVAHTQANKTNYLISVCPMDYCLPYSSSVNLLHPDLQCQFNRTGILCSQCPHPLSMVFASSRCMKCTNVHILITIIVIVAGIVLVVLLYVLNLTVTNGTINGIIFYANIVSINDSIFLVNDNVLKALRVFISFTNLDLGIKTCFYNGMDSYAKMWLQLFFPSYLIIITISIIIVSRYSTRILRLTYSRSLPVLATLFLLSYTGVLRTVLTVLFSYSTITHLPSGHQQLVWSIDASIPLFGIKFTILFITCLVLFLILIPFNITLLFTRYFLQFRIVNRFKPLLDAFQGSYKDKYYYWVAVHLTLRSFLFFFYAFPTKLRLILSTILLIVLGIYSGYACPHKNKLVNIQELLLLMNLTIMYAVSYQSNDKIFSIVNNVMVSVSFMQCTIIIFCHLLTYTCHCDMVWMLKKTKQKLIALYNKRYLNCNSSNIVLLNIPERTYNYTEYRDGLVSDDFK